MPESLKVIALISGGKDSFFSTLHCLEHGHQIVALANLHPQQSGTLAEESGVTTSKAQFQTSGYNDLDDIESHMYQTIGHSVLPLYASALNIPIYRQPIRGTAVNKSKTYQPPATLTDDSVRQIDQQYRYGECQVSHEASDDSSMQDETESLISLLQSVKSEHPEANALSSGAILSTYQRTRVESVAIRLNLVPLAYLWQYPLLPPYTQSSLLHDMRAVGMDARIVKVASGGLDAGILWENVADHGVIRRLRRAMQRFSGADGVQVGAVVGEGGEFETLTLDGPRILFARRILIEDTDRQVILGDGGTAITRILKASIVGKEQPSDHGSCNKEEITEHPRLPDVWDSEIADLLCSWEYIAARDEKNYKISTLDESYRPKNSHGRLRTTYSTTPSTIYISNIEAKSSASVTMTSAEQATEIISTLCSSLSLQNLTTEDLSFTTILLRSMASFAEVNTAYSSLFTHPNPPARITVAVGDLLPPGVDVIMSFTAERQHGGRPGEKGLEAGFIDHKKSLHVQSRSYWAPANIGPYSQAVSIPFAPRNEYRSSIAHEGGKDNREGDFEVVHVAGQIPLVPATMTMIKSADFREHAALSLQHLWRVGRAMNVRWWGGGAVAFVTAADAADARERALIIGRIWEGMHKCIATGDDSDNETEEVDVGDAALYHPWDLNARTNSTIDEDADKTFRAPLPDWSCLSVGPSRDASNGGPNAPPCFTAEVAELPREAYVEWWSFGFAGKGWSLNVDKNEQRIACNAGSLSVTWQSCTTIEELRQLLCSANMADQGEESKDRSGYMEIITSIAFAEELVMEARAMVIPCKSVWDVHGKKLCAAVRVRQHKDVA